MYSCNYVETLVDSLISPVRILESVDQDIPEQVFV